MPLIFIIDCFRTKYNIPAIDQILEAQPTAELEPLQDGQLAQLDEVDMGMTYVELGIFGRLRKQNYAGPFSMFCRLVNDWNGLTPKEVIFFFLLFQHFEVFYVLYFALRRVGLYDVRSFS